jgi:hypothetical protein
MTIAPHLTDLEIGKAAEHIVVADIILSGYRAYLTDQGTPYDIVLDDRGRLYRVQVKATRELRPVPQRAAFTPGYLFHVRRAGKGGRRSYSESEFDLMALVALDIRVIAYMPFADAVKQSLVLRPPNHQPANNATRLQNIDQFPLEAALSLLREMMPSTENGLGRVDEWTADAATAATNLTRNQRVDTDSSAVTRQIQMTLPKPWMA